MTSPRVSKDFNDKIYFLTFTIKRWYYLFDRYYRWNILADSLKYCRSSKGLKLYGFVFMLNHIHLVVSSPDVAGFIRDFKRYTSRELHKNISQTEPNILQLFLDENGKYEFWSKTNMPKLIETEKFLYQKMEYIHANPVRKNYVAQADHWYWSSANLNCEIEVDNIWES
ncbi:MAG: transposase [Candidatus Moranbacteria bacterium]|nr:transposase [Candidatus Moranbacteria bacterium]